MCLGVSAPQGADAVFCWPCWLLVRASRRGVCAADVHRWLVGLRRLESLLLHGQVRHLKRWADKYGVVIKVQRFDYAASLDAFVAKNIDACTMTNMEALDMPAAAGVDSTAVIIGDYSNGNDAVLARNNLTLAQLAGKPILLVQKTVSEYLLERAMDMNGLNGQLGRLKLLNTSDSDIVGAFLGDKSNQVAVTWKPLVSEILAQDSGVKELFDSSRIPGEILDLLVVRSEVLKRPDGSGVEVCQGRHRRVV